MKTNLPVVALLLFSLVPCGLIFAQAEVSGWGNLRGIRVRDQLVPLTSAVAIYGPDFSHVVASQREGPTRTTQYTRKGDALTVGINLQYLDRMEETTGARAPATIPTPGRGPRGAGGRGAAGPGISYAISYTDVPSGVCEVGIQLTSTIAQPIAGIYYVLDLPADDFANGSAELDEKTIPLVANQDGRYLTASSKRIRITGDKKQSVELSFPESHEIVVEHSGRAASSASSVIRVRFPLVVGSVPPGQSATAKFTLKASAEIDTTPATVSIDSSDIGRTWLGIGGNYRIQDLRLDPLHVKYIMDNMRVSYGRVAMPWNVWQPDEASPPTTAPSARGGGGGAMNSLPAALQMAEQLAKKNIPMILSVWSPPSWAVLPNPPGRRGGAGAGGERGQRLDPTKWDAICKSIGSYLLYLREHHGAEPLFFSFNESDLGINVRQTPEDHNEAIRKLGAHFKSIGLKTKMLLGDTSDAMATRFIQVALNDPETAPYIGAVSFHSWRGAADDIYEQWAAAAARLGVPLIDAEGGNDAQAYSYPAIFVEPWYSLDEAAEYVRIMRICQPLAILQWQLTQNYSVLATDETGGLHPTQRFYNLKQFNLAPSGSRSIAAQSSSGRILPAAFVHQTTGTCALHLVNNGTSRQVTIIGLPASVTRMDVFVTDRLRGMEKINSVEVRNGSAQLVLEGQTLTSLVSAAAQ